MRSADGEENQHGDESVGGEEGGIEAAEIVGFDQAVLVDESQSGDGDSGGGQMAEAEAEEHPGKEEEGDEVKEAGETERAGDAEGAGNGMESAGDVVLVILATVENVEASAPEHDGSGDDEDAGIERAANRDPGGGGSNAHGEAEK